MASLCLNMLKSGQYFPARGKFHAGPLTGRKFSKLWHRVVKRPELNALRLFFSKSEEKQEDGKPQSEGEESKDQEKTEENDEKKESNKKGDENENSDNKDRTAAFSKFFITSMFCCILFLYFIKPESKQGITQSELNNLLTAKQIEKIMVSTYSSYVTIYLKDNNGKKLFKTTSTAEFIKMCKEAQDAANIDPGERPKIIERVPYESAILQTIVGIALFIVLLMIAGRFMTNSMNATLRRTGISDITKKDPMGMNNLLGIMMSGGKSKAVEYGKNRKVDVKFKDVAGMKGPKEEIQEFVSFLKNPEKFRKLGAKIPKGALLSGPPGTGKTLLAKACAGEAEVPFFATSGSDFIELIAGLGASRVRDLFKEAKKKSPSIIFIDEIDSIGRHRANLGRNSEQESTLNQIFVEMDGFGTDTNVIVFAATNRKDALDKALIRPGRFDRVIEVDLPSLEERKEIFGVHLAKIVVGKEVEKSKVAERLAGLTMGMSGADIYSICNEAAIMAARNNKQSVDMDSFYEAFDRVLTGLKRDLPLTEEDRRTTAFHESGHTVVAWFLEHAQNVLKVLAPNLLGLHRPAVQRLLRAHDNDGGRGGVVQTGADRRHHLHDVRRTRSRGTLPLQRHHRRPKRPPRRHLIRQEVCWCIRDGAGLRQRFGARLQQRAGDRGEHAVLGGVGEEVRQGGVRRVRGAVQQGEEDTEREGEGSEQAG